MKAKYKKYTKKYMNYLRNLHLIRNYVDQRPLRRMLCHGVWKSLQQRNRIENDKRRTKEMETF